MANLNSLLEISKNSDVLTIEATVDTGFELIAEQECREKFGSELQFCHDRGRVYLNFPVSQFSVHSDLQLIENLTNKINWEKYLNTWKSIVGFNGVIFPSYYSVVNSNDTFQIKEEHLNDEIKKSNILKYRVTCYRSGQHSFSSQEAARSFGGRLHDRFHWTVNLSNFQLEIILKIKDDLAKILVAITECSMHRRNLSYFGITTLRSTISYNLLRIAKPVIGEIIMDPLCGSGSIPMEGAIGMPESFYVCGDINQKSIDTTALNKITYNEKYGNNLLLDPLHWNVCALPLKDSCIDVVVTDLPFGKRVGSKFQNRTLYSKIMKELARVVVPLTGRIVLLTTDRTSYNLGFQHNKKYWKQMKMLVVKLGGLKACVYFLTRTRLIFNSKLPSIV